MSKQIRLENESFQSTDRVLIDANIWTFTKNPYRQTTNPAKASAYIDHLADLTKSGAELFTTTEVISEFLNTFLRNAFSVWKKQTGQLDADYKRGFRRQDMQAYVNAYDLAADIIRNEIVGMANMTLLPSEELKVHTVIENLSHSSLDFTDEILLQTASLGQLSIFTDDYDLANTTSNIKIYKDFRNF